MINSDVLKGYNDIIILNILQEGDSYGYAISKRIREVSGGQYSIKETTLYSAFYRLEKNGYIEKYYGTQSLGKKRSYYKITSSGNNYYLKKCNEWNETQSIINKFTMEV